MLLEQHIEELKLELREAIDPAERREMEIELELARAELAVIIAEQEGANLSGIPSRGKCDLGP
jgi:hypothetical protein